MATNPRSIFHLLFSILACHFGLRLLDFGFFISVSLPFQSGTTYGHRPAVGDDAHGFCYEGSFSMRRLPFAKNGSVDSRSSDRISQGFIRKGVAPILNCAGVVKIHPKRPWESDGIRGDTVSNHDQGI